VLLITDKQIQSLNSIPLTIFFRRVEDFIRENMEDSLIRKVNLPNYIKQSYDIAKAEGLDTEQEILTHILNDLSKLGDA
jgi:hypothetical protein